MSAPRRRHDPPHGPLVGLAELAASRRRLLGLTQRATAELADVGISSIYALEDGSDRLTLEILMRILDALGLALAVAPPARLATATQVVILDDQRP